MDSAGLRQTNCPVETEGVRRALAAAQQAHVVLHLSDASSGSAAAAASDSAGVQQQQQQAGAALAAPLAHHAVQLVVHNKVDLLQPAAADVAVAAGAEQAPAAAPSLTSWVGEQTQQAAAASAGALLHPPPPPPPLLISCKSGQGIEQLLTVLQQQVAALVARDGDDGAAGALVTRTRHRFVALVAGSVVLLAAAVFATPCAGHSCLTALLCAAVCRCCRHHLAEAVAAMQRYDGAAQTQVSWHCRCKQQACLVRPAGGCRCPLPSNRCSLMHLPAVCRSWRLRVRSCGRRRGRWAG
jgi:hypothetical protein